MRPVVDGPRPSLISVRTEVVMDVLVDDLLAAARERAKRELGPQLQSAMALSACEPLARLGYESRAVELERFEPARAPMPWLEEALAERGGDAGATSSELARREPASRPAPDDPDAATWRVPGPGGHVRHYLALRAAGEAGPSGLDPAVAKRCWTYGFMLRCCEEVAARPR